MARLTPASTASSVGVFNAPKATQQPALTYNGQEVTTIRASQLQQAWAVMTVQERSGYIKRFAALGYDTSTDDGQKNAWSKVVSNVAQNYNNGLGVTQNIADYLKDLEAGEKVAASTPEVINRQTYVNAESQFKAYMAVNNLKLSPSSIAAYSQSVVDGTSKIENILAGFRETTVNQYPAWADRINAGQSIQQIAEPYIQAKARLLELNVESITLDDNDINRSLTTVSADGKPSFKPQWQFEQELRGTDDYWKTSAANNDAASFAGALRQEMGR